MGNAVKSYSHNEIRKIANEQSSKISFEMVELFCDVLESEGCRFTLGAMASNTQWAFITGLTSVYTAGYIGGKQDERIRRRGGVESNG